MLRNTLSAWSDAAVISPAFLLPRETPASRDETVTWLPMDVDELAPLIPAEHIVAAVGSRK
jgi:hypothetical protein